MEKLKKGMVTVFAVAILIIPTVSMAGDLEPPGPPGPTMHTLDEIYQKLEQLTGKGAAPAEVEKTGQTVSYGTGDDGYWQKGVAWPSPRFTDNGNGTVTDNLTGLIWLKNANCFSTRDWATALSDANNLSSGNCGLSDESSAGDWRLPNIKELQSLIDYTVYNPALPSGAPFTSVVKNFYWSSTTYAAYTDGAWGVDMSIGDAYSAGKGSNRYVWPVRGGN